MPPDVVIKGLDSRFAIDILVKDQVRQFMCKSETISRRVIF